MSVLMVDAVAFALLRRHVVRRAEHLAGAREPLRTVRDFGDTKVEDLHEVLDVVAPSQKYVLGFEVPMDDPRVVRRAERLAELDRDVNRAALRACVEPCRSRR